MKLPEILPCPFCNGAVELHVSNPKFYGLTGAYVRCTRCKARGPLTNISEPVGQFCAPVITDSSIERGKINAVQRWNDRRAAV